MGAEESVLEDLAERIGRGERIDWEQAARSATDQRLRASILSLRSLDRMRRFAAGGNGEDDAAGEETTRLLASQAQTGTAPLGRWAHLVLREVLGQGAQGKVYRAWDPELECEVALKLNCEDRIGLGEARRLARVRHPHVVQVHGAAKDGDSYGIWMEYIRGRKLSDRILQEGPLGEDEALEVGRKLASAVVAIHAVNVVHQDIKAGNVMREHGGRYVLLDLGCGADLDKGQREVGGTPFYMAPEMLRGGRPSKSADVYSLGVLLYHLVSGSFPYRGNDLDELSQAHRAGRPRSLQELRSDLSPGFVAVVEKAIAVEPRDRYRSAAALLRALEELSLHRAPQPGPGLLARLGRRTAAFWHGRGRVARGAALTALGLLLVAGGAWLLWPRLEVEVGLQRWSGQTQQAVADGGIVRTGDILVLQLEGNWTMHVHVFGTDDRGEIRRLFPMTGCSLQNPLSGGTTHLLPGERDGRPVGWRVTSGGGERILVVAMTRPSARLESLAASVPEIGADTSDELGPVRGLGDAAELPEASSAVYQGADLLARIREAAGSGAGTWIRELVLHNR
jgi:hypothetical protein